MNQVTRRGGRRGTARAAAATVALFLVGVLALVLGIRGSDGPPQPVAVAAAPSSISATQPGVTPSPSPSKTRSAAAPNKAAPAKKKAAPAKKKAAPAKKKKSSQPRIGQLLPASEPIALEIPSIGVRSSNFVDLEVAKDGTLDVPGRGDEVGFYTGGPTPGQFGSAVLGAHVDSDEGPGIFYNLGAVQVGDKIHVGRKDKTRVTFVVDKVAVYPKDDFPTDEVYYGSFDRAEIRLVTCGGTFDRVKHYLDNVVVFGHLAT